MTGAVAIDRLSMAALAFEWTVIALATAAALAIETWWATAGAFVVVATRQHALLILYHDAVHGHFSRSAPVNDFIVNLAVGVPTLMPVEVYRPLHFEHHRALGTGNDPERLLLYARQAWNYRPLPLGALLRQALGDLFVVNGLRTLAEWRRAWPMPSLRWQTVAIAVVWTAALGAWAWLAPGSASAALVLWIAPLLTLTQLLQKLRSFAEHSGGPGVTPGWQDWTYSWRIGLPGRMTIWPYHINCHREHHERPDLRWHQLPAAAIPGTQLAGWAFWRLLRQSAAPPARD